MTIKTWAASLGFVVIGWVALQLGVMFFTDAAPGAMVLFPSAGFISRLPDNTGIVDIGTNWVTVASDDPSLGRKLYAAGALIVLPAGLPRCLPLR